MFSRNEAFVGSIMVSIILLEIQFYRKRLRTTAAVKSEVQVLKHALKHEPQSAQNQLSGPTGFKAL
jgi:hypothetical protein